jgi:PPK2 family polyphosphate:nucleotide phosphotransferase
VSRRSDPPADAAARRAWFADQLRVTPGSPAQLAERDTGWVGGPDFEQLQAEELDDLARARLAASVEALADAQELLWADATRAVLVVFQAMDAAGKDSTIKHVMTGVNPQGVDVTSFRRPTEEELAHPFLWRTWQAVPAKGRIGIFNRSHYEEVVALRVHPEWLGPQALPGGAGRAGLWASRHADINAFEQHLDHTGVTTVKFFLHVSRAEQRRRFLRRLDRPHKEWKFNAADVAERQRWDDYMAAFEEAITATSTPWAPWYVIPADHKHVMQAMVATILVDAITGLGLAWPTVSPEEHAANVRARQELLAEDGTDPADPSRADGTQTRRSHP